MGMRAGEVTPLLGPDGPLPDKNTNIECNISVHPCSIFSHAVNIAELTHFKEH